MSAVHSKTPPTIAPTTFDAKAMSAARESRNENENATLAKKIGAKTSAAAIAQVWKRPVVDRGWHRASDERKHGGRARPRADGEPRAEPAAELRVRADDRIDPEDVAERGRVPVDQERLAVRVVEDNNPAGREVVARRLEGLAREEE